MLLNVNTIFSWVLGLLLACSSTNVNLKSQDKLIFGNEGELNLENIIGVLSLSDSYSKNDTIILRNKDGSEWYKFTFYYDDSDGKFEYYNPSFYPLAFHQDYFLLGLAIIKELEDRYIVVVDHRDETKKEILKDDFLKLFKLEKFILEKVFSVSFDKGSNPLKINPNDKAFTIKTPVGTTFYPVKFDDNWLRVKWQEGDEWKQGWINWKRENKLIIKFFFF